MSFKRLPALVRPMLVAGLIGLLALSAPARAQNDNGAAAPPALRDPKAVVVTVGGDAITEADIGFAAEDLGQELNNIPVNDRRAFLVAVLIDMKVMAQAARTAKLDETEIYKQRLNYLEERSLRRAYFSDKIAASITEASVQVAYDKLVAEFKPEEEVRARHILVSTEDDAKSVKAEIDSGKPFEVAALEYSQDGTAQNGGDLGFFSRTSDIVQPFKDAAFALEVGKLSDPVETQFGWHLIKLEEKRMSSPPALQQLLPQIQQQLMVEAFDKEMTALKTDVAISFTDPELEKAVNAGTEAVQQGGE